jgi:hypothetical protein
MASSSLDWYEIVFKFFVTAQGNARKHCILGVYGGYARACAHTKNSVISPHGFTPHFTENEIHDLE